MKVSIVTLAGLLMCAVGQQVVVDGKGGQPDWQNKHMAEEHHITDFDAEAFFKLHDLSNQDIWTRKDILSLYGLARDEIVGDGSGMGDHLHEEEAVSEEKKNEVVNKILALMDTNGDGVVSLDEWRTFVSKGNKLPDFGTGTGHHLDFESEYEEHHWKEYHMNEDPDVKIKHKEDIQHEILHHEHEIEESHKASSDVRNVAKNYKFKVRTENIPPRYRRA
ncbi:Piso0_002391 [Millerozyma farinosa CBS 7064]|uniref:Piso0_002391 protein n=1 Tax=Pichia sorbitophila (strain ATCC MYA-4447 / BCRC 22081 / CBS 7064 / NBRC 10061 / NRRL Y-12695) TaxID=559304 RepID=G8YCH5_PICSO|nr:Piso0_002391 [Millerozyma farinosa CBS 7064]